MRVSENLPCYQMKKLGLRAGGVCSRSQRERQTGTRIPVSQVSSPMFFSLELTNLEMNPVTLELSATLTPHCSFKKP